MNRRIIAFVALAIALAAVFVRLGFWQLDRLRQRRSRNAEVAARLAQPVVRIDQLYDTTAFRRVVVAGTPDYANEIVFTGRSRQGSPGVYILTPMRRATNDTAVVVNRGWVYAPDAATADLSRWRESRGVYTGYVSTLARGAAAPNQHSNERKVRALTWNGIQALLPYPVAGMYVVSQDSAGDGTPARLPAPTLDDGPHLSYAIQWFSFAAIALVGAGVVVSRARAQDKAGATDA